jgi:SAM-dependent MidA family methyltransferase
VNGGETSKAPRANAAHGAPCVPLGALLERLISGIRARGPIPFADYMDACLYDPELGYYSGGIERGRADYYTSVDVSPIFGRLLARQFEEMWRIAGRPEAFSIVEAGAGSGRLARHILDFAAERLGDFYPALQYAAVEISASRRGLLQAGLAAHIAAGRALSLRELPSAVACGCIFSNELLDALPVHRVVMRAEGLREIFVDWDGERLLERELPPSSPEIAEYFARQDVVLRVGQQADAGLAACRWIEDAGRRLDRGFLLTVDYGHSSRELYDERHMDGTLLGYSRHRATEDFYRAPGEIDITAHVNFSALGIWGRGVGLELAGLISQTEFLLGLARATDFADLVDAGWSELEKTRGRLSFQNLVNPEGMGETFRVMIQRKGIEAARLVGFGDFA